MRYNPFIILLAAAGLAFIVLLFLDSSEAEARPILPPHALTEAQKVRWCHFRHKTDYQAKAACTVRVAWRGNWRDGVEAVRVGWCESGLNHTRGIPYATYQGAWQFDADARRTYGWGPTLLPQIKATVRIHRARGWQPFPECKPLGKAHAERWAHAPRSVRQYG